MARDWTKLLPASFKGVSFHVDSEDASGGRRLVVHQTAGGENPLVEDFGKGLITYQVTAYLTGDDCDAKAKSLFDAATSAGAGPLVLPIDSGLTAYVPEDGVRRARAKDRNGYIAVDLSFIVVGSSGGAMLGLGDIGFAFSVGVGAATISFSGLF
jgi:prophage DNA circulation protein